MSERLVLCPRCERARGLTEGTHADYEQIYGAYGIRVGGALVAVPCDDCGSPPAWGESFAIWHRKETPNA